MIDQELHSATQLTNQMQHPIDRSDATPNWPIRCETKTNCLVSHFLSHIRKCTCFHFELSLSSCSIVLCSDWLLFVITLLWMTSSLHRFITNCQHNDYLVVDLLAHLVEYCTSIANIKGSNPVQALMFLRPYVHYCLSNVNYWEDRFHIQSLL